MIYNFYIDPVARKVNAEEMVVLWKDQNVSTIHFTVEDFEGFTFDGASLLIKAVLPDKTQVEITPDNITIEPVVTIGDDGEEIITGYSTSFDWPLTMEHTRMVGTISYSICAIILDLDGETINKEWHTLNDSFQVHDHIHFNGSDDQDDPVQAATNAEKISALRNVVGNLGVKIDSIASAVPEVAVTAADMTDTSSIYVYAGSESGYMNGYWYYWDGNTWKAGGKYGSAVDKTLTASDAPADAKTVGDRLDAVDVGLERVTGTTDALADIMGDKVDGAYVEDGVAYFTSGDMVLFSITGIGGGGGGDSSLTELVFQNLTGWASKSMSEGGDCRLAFNWSSTADGYDTGSGTLTIQVKGVTVINRSVAQGALEADVSKFLQAGSNRIKATITDSYGNRKSIVFNVTVISLSVTSSYDQSQVQAGPFDVSYVVTGSGEKTVHFIMDHEEIGTETITTSGRQATFMVPAQDHGDHLLELYASSSVEGAEVESNHLYLTVISVEAGNLRPVIASSYAASKAPQYDAIVIPYYVYNPASMTAKIQIEVNGEVYTEQTVDRTQQTFVYRAREVGELEIDFICGTTRKTFDLEIVKSDADIYPETEKLVLYLSAEGRSNNESDPSSWQYEGISASMTGFNFTSDGWLLDEDNNTVLRVTGDARVEIPYSIFKNDFRSTGKTIEIEFEAHDTRDYDAEILTCWSNDRGLKLTAQNAMLSSEQSSINTQYKEDEHVRVAFVVEKRSENRLIYIYINGIMSGVVQYPEDDDFSQANPVGISIGSSMCTVDIYNIRIYDNDLTRFQILTNWIADTQNIEQMLERYERNNVFDDYGSIVIDKLPADLPYMTLIPTGSNPHLPQYKGDKTPTSVAFVDESGTFVSFEATGAQNNVQGTSSQYYPRKNYKVSYKGGFVVNGDLVDIYAIRDGAIPTNAFTYKADVASSEGANNVELARLFNMVAPETPGMKKGSGIRQTIDGFPIVMFHNDGSSTTFIGKYNFNNDKGTSEVYGFARGDESWEIKNNTSDRVRFKSADFTGDGWKEDFEGSYPEDYENTTHLAAMCEWVVSTDGDPEKFKKELADWFNLDNCLAYYLFTEMFLMVDSRVKNAFPTYWASEGKWYWRLYDADTAIGINNEGTLAFGYELEDTDHTSSGADIFNGQDSTFWNNLRIAFADEIQAKWQSWRSEGTMSYDVVETMFEEHQARWPEAIFNEDSYYKYIKPLLDASDGTYLPMAQGSKAEQRKWWLYNRFRYMDSKYSAGDTLTDYIQLRGYAKDDIVLTPYAHMYAAVRFAQTLVKQRGLRGASYRMVCPLDKVNDTEIYIYDASRLASVGDLSGLKVGLADFSRAIKLQEIKIGDSDPEYTNGNLTSLTLGNNTLLKTLDVRNCSGLTQAVDISGCTNIEEVYFDGTAITGLNLPNGGVLRELHLPGTVTNLTIRNQPSLETFIMPSYDNISTLRIENVGSVVDIDSILDAMADNGRVRIIGLRETMSTIEEVEAFYDRLDKMRGLDEAGNNVDTAQVQGTITGLGSITGAWVAEMNARYPDITIQAEHVTAILTYLTYDGSSTIDSETIIDGGTGTKVNSTARNADVQYTYAPDGWATMPNGDKDEDALKNVTADRTVYAAYSKTLRTYDVYFIRSTDDGGGTLQTLTSIPYGTNITAASRYSADTPTTTKGETADYPFEGWEPASAMVMGNTTFTARFGSPFEIEEITDSWDEIIASIDAGTYSTKYKVGNYKPLDLGTEGIINMQIVAMDADEVESGGHAPLTLLSKNFLQTKRKLTDDISLSSWSESGLRTVLNSTVLDLVPAGVRSRICKVNKTSRPAEGKEEAAADTLWIPSIREMYPEGPYQEKSGVEYKIYQTQDFFPTATDGTNQEFALRSLVDTEYNFSGVKSSSVPKTRRVYTYQFICIGFCLG